MSFAGKHLSARAPKNGGLGVGPMGSHNEPPNHGNHKMGGKLNLSGKTRLSQLGDDNP